ncbi:MAG: hypothetical protein WC464_00645 [Bdellovibrionales bacterium]
MRSTKILVVTTFVAALVAGPVLAQEASTTNLTLRPATVEAEADAMTDAAVAPEKTLKAKQKHAVRKQARKHKAKRTTTESETSTESVK